MSPLAVILVLAAAVLHAGWNLLAKQVPSGLPFVSLVSACSVVLLAPAAAIVAMNYDAGLNVLGWGLVLGSAILHVSYFLGLQYGYAISDLSVTYPLARGSAPLMSTTGAIIVLGDRPSALGWLGLAGFFTLFGLMLTWKKTAVDESFVVPTLQGPDTKVMSVVIELKV